jgi:hypothetical protein
MLTSENDNHIQRTRSISESPGQIFTARAYFFSALTITHLASKNWKFVQIKETIRLAAP